MKKIYTAIAGQIIESFADTDQLESQATGKPCYLLPAGATFSEGEAANWAADQQSAIDKAAEELIKIPKSMAAIRSDKQAQIKSERDRRMDLGGYQVDKHWYHSDSKSRIQQLGLLSLGASIPKELSWKTMSGQFVPMTPELAGQIFAAAAKSDMTIFATAEAKLAALEAMESPAQFYPLADWPLCFTDPQPELLELHAEESKV